MAETTVIIEGGATNKSFVLDLLDQPEVTSATADTGWIDRARGQGRLVARRHSAVALAVAAIEAYEEEERVERQRLLATASGGRPQVQHESARPLELKLRGASYRVRVARVGAHRFRVGIDAAGGAAGAADVELDRFDRHTGQATVNGTRFRLVTGTHGPVHLVEVDGVAHRVSRDEGGVVRSPAPALVVATPLAVGAEVEAGAPLLVLESMKMETVLRAPFRARLTECSVSVGSQVGTGTALLRLEPLGGDGDRVPEAAAAAELDLPAQAPGAPAAERAERGLQDLRSLLLGFDVDPHDERRVLAGYLAARQELAGAGQLPLAGEVELLSVFADLSELSRNQQAGEEPGADRRVHSAREHFHAYLQSLDVDRAGLPEAFQAQLRRALGHYGVTGLERTPELEEAVFRIFLAQQRAASDAAVVITLLREWLREAPPGEALREPAGLALERLIAATQVRFPVVSDLARGVVFAWFGQPLLRRNRARVYADVRRDLRYLDAHPDAPDRAARIAAMVGSTEPLVRLLGQRLGRGGLDHAVMLEVLTRRYYGNKGLADVAEVEAAGGTFVVAERAGSRLASTAVSFDALGGALRGLAAVADSRGQRHRRRHLPGVGEAAGGLRRDGGRAARGHQRAPAAGPGAPADRHGRREPRRGDAPSLHVPPVGRRGDERGPADPRPAPVHRAADAAGAAAQVRPDPAAVLRRGDLPVPVRRAGEPVRRPARRVRAGPRPDRAAGARRPAGGAADGRGRRRHLPRLDPPGAVAAAGRQALPDQPDHRLHLAGDRGRLHASWPRSPPACCRPPPAPGWRRSCSSPGGATRRPARWPRWPCGWGLMPPAAAT